MSPRTLFSVFMVDPPSRQGTLAAPFPPPPSSVTGHSPASQVRRGRGRPQVQGCQRQPPAGLPGRLTALPSLADASLPTGGCAPGCLCSAQRSSWLLTASLRFLLWVVLEIRVLHYTGQPL